MYVIEHTPATNLASLIRARVAFRSSATSNFTADSSVPLNFKKNRLLAALPATEWQRWSSSLEAVEMPLGQVLYEPGVALNCVYFPLTSIVSLLYVMENGASAEIAVVGNEGIVGVSSIHGRRIDPQPRRGTKCGFRLPAEGADHEG